MKRFYSTLLLLLIVVQGICQLKTPRYGSCKTPMPTSCPRNSFYHETYANFTTLNFNSINWDHTLICKPKFMLTSRIGFVYCSFPKINSIGAPLEFNFLVGGNSWVFEFGLGVHYLYFYKNYAEIVGKYKDAVNYLAASARVGVRYELDNSIFFHAGFTPMYSILGDDQIPRLATGSKFLPMLGLGIGYTLR